MMSKLYKFVPLDKNGKEFQTPISSYPNLIDLKLNEKEIIGSVYIKIKSKKIDTLKNIENCGMFFINNKNVPIIKFVDEFDLIEFVELQEVNDNKLEKSIKFNKDELYHQMHYLRDLMKNNPNNIKAIKEYVNNILNLYFNYEK